MKKIERMIFRGGVLGILRVSGLLAAIIFCCFCVGCSGGQDSTTTAFTTPTPTHHHDDDELGVSAIADKTKIVEGDVVNFQGSISGGKAPYDCLWDFDGGAANSATKDPGNVIFAAAGTFVVTLNVTDANKNTGEASVTIEVQPAQQPQPQPQPQPPQPQPQELKAVITSPVGNNVAIKTGLSVNFQGSVSGGKAPYVCLWDFNGGATNSSVEDPGDVTFDTAGTYTVTFNVTDADQSAKSASVTITVESPAVTWKNVAPGLGFTIGLKTDGTLWAWGYNEFGQLGDGTNISKDVPTQIGTNTDWAMVSAGERHGMAIKTDGTLWTWGNDSYGQLGQGDGVDDQNAPVQVGTEDDWLMVDTGFNHCLALKKDGTLWAWGNNGSGQLGDGTSQNNRKVPTKIGTESNWRTISTGEDHSVAIKTDGTLWAWGGNSYGQLGSGLYYGYRATPTQVGTENNWQKVSASATFSIALKTDGTLWAWGYDCNGHLGLGSDFSVAYPTQIGTDNDWVSVATGSDHTLAIKTDGTLWAWGGNHSGQLGTNNGENSYAPTHIGSDSNWSMVFAGHDSSYGFKADKTLWRWGSVWPTYPDVISPQKFE